VDQPVLLLVQLVPEEHVNALGTRRSGLESLKVMRMYL
jgi:hypothetical protein